MKFTYRLLSCLLLLTALGCQKENGTVMPDQEASSSSTARVSTTNLRLKQMLVSGNNGGLGPMFTTTYFQYNQGNQLEKATAPTNTMAGKLTYEYTYDQQGRLSVYRVLNENSNNEGYVGTQSNFTRSTGKIVQSYARVQANGQLLPPYLEPNLKTTYHINGQGQIIEQIQEGIIRYGSETSQRVVYTYENGNVVRQKMVNAQGQTEFTISYKYDDKVNPFYQKSYLFDPALHCSRNNVVSTQFNNNSPQLRKYTYNTQGLPITQTYVSTGAVLKYVYEISEGSAVK
ncbi:hypothetical protein FEM33_17860 [Dyadobacter flavalbus]|uniref:RHS repeat protein n=1 Tax=Dyadobacter flavalbus TaxID=2579942 RepID=A0A5M8QQL8_9BACT|nr:hypothetical protein [Dyadobacter flavalbus]KAA6438547.1 hypothetical protein FEM33_17860 [Dyadobacter flavalbus]